MQELSGAKVDRDYYRAWFQTWELQKGRTAGRAGWSASLAGAKAQESLMPQQRPAAAVADPSTRVTSWGAVPAVPAVVRAVPACCASLLLLLNPPNG